MADENNVKVTTAILAIQEAREEGRAQGFAEGKEAAADAIEKLGLMLAKKEPSQKERRSEP